MIIFFDYYVISVNISFIKRGFMGAVNWASMFLRECSVSEGCYTPARCSLLTSERSFLMCMVKVFGNST